MSFYAYMYLRGDGTPYYVGKGSGYRAYVKHRGLMRPPKTRSRILIFERCSEQEAFDTEIDLIRNWGRQDLGTGILKNMTDGGDGPPSSKGRKHSSETKAKIGTKHKGKIISPEMRLAMSLSRKGKPVWNKGKKGLQKAWNKGIKTGPNPAHSEWMKQNGANLFQRGHPPTLGSFKLGYDERRVRSC
jgi:NUMOD3 motif-containing protein